MPAIDKSTICKLLLRAGLAAAAPLAYSEASAQMLLFSHQLSPSQRACLTDVINGSEWGSSAESSAQMPAIAQVATARLSDHRKSYVFVFDAEWWCGTAGCPLLIGEVEQDGSCRLLYDDMGDETFTVLRRRDHGYKRIYTPCEARYDGKQYRAVHEDCPSPLTPR